MAKVKKGFTKDACGKCKTQTTRSPRFPKLRNMAGEPLSNHSYAQAHLHCGGGVGDLQGGEDVLSVAVDGVDGDAEAVGYLLAADALRQECEDFPLSAAQQLTVYLCVMFGADSLPSARIDDAGPHRTLDPGEGIVGAETEPRTAAWMELHKARGVQHGQRSRALLTEMHHAGGVIAGLVLQRHGFQELEEAEFEDVPLRQLVLIYTVEDDALEGGACVLAVGGQAERPPEQPRTDVADISLPVRQHGDAIRCLGIGFSFAQSGFKQRLPLLLRLELLPRQQRFQLVPFLFHTNWLFFTIARDRNIAYLCSRENRFANLQQNINIRNETQHYHHHGGRSPRLVRRCEPAKRQERNGNRQSDNHKP